MPYSITQCYLPPDTSHPSKYYPDPAQSNLVIASNVLPRAKLLTTATSAVSIALSLQMLKISWVDKVSNAEVLQTVQENKSILDTVQHCKFRRIGHILRHDSLLRDIIEGTVKGKVTRGRKRLQMLSAKVPRNCQSFCALHISTQCKKAVVRKHNKPRPRVAHRGIARFLGIDQKCNQVVPWSLYTFPENFMQIGPAVCS